MFLPRVVLLALSCALPLLAQTPEVHEKRLPKGSRILFVERPGSGSVHIRLVFRGGLSAFPEIPPPALRQVARVVFGRMDESDRGPAPQLEALLGRISGAADGLRKAEQSRLRLGAPVPLEADLRALVQDQIALLRETLPQGPDLMEALGATRRKVRVESDFLETSLELPSAAIQEWAVLEASRLATLRLARLPVTAPDPPASGGSPGMDVLLGAAFPGHPYGRSTGGDPAVTLPWAEARVLAKRALAPDRMVLVLVGDFVAEATLPVLEQAFSTQALSANPLSEPREAEASLAPNEPPPGARRLLATTTLEPRLLVGWRVPPADHPDTQALRLLASALGEGPSCLLRQALVESGLAQDVRLTFGVPGQRDTRLMTVEALPEPGRNLQELALAIEGEMLRLQQDPLPAEDLRRLQLGAMVTQLETLADPESLARALGEATAGTGDWRSAFPSWRQATFDPETLQSMARKYFIPSRRTEALLESDPLESNQDLLERQMSAALLRLAAAKGMDAAHAEELARQTLRQLRMVPREDRQALLYLLTRQDGKR